MTLGVSNLEEHTLFKHECFQRNNPKLLPKIKRSTNKKATTPAKEARIIKEISSVREDTGMLEMDFDALNSSLRSQLDSFYTSTDNSLEMLESSMQSLFPHHPYYHPQDHNNIASDPYQNYTFHSHSNDGVRKRTFDHVVSDATEEKKPHRRLF